MMPKHINSDSCRADRKGLFAVAETMIVYGIISILLHCLVLSAPVYAGTETGEFCPTCPDWNDIDGWLAKKAAYDQEQTNVKLESQQITLKTQNADPDPVKNANTTVQSNYSSSRTGKFAEVLVSPAEVSPDDIVLDISPSATRYIEGAVNINYEGFTGEGGQFKSVPEMATLLGDAGISRNDSLVIAGECLPCGGGPSPAIFTYWLLKYLGHEKVRVLDDSIDDWAAAGRNTSNKSAIRPKTDYNPLLKPELLATYDFVVNGGAQIVDARPARDYGIGSIPGAVNIPYENVVVNESIKPQEDLHKVFVGLEKDLPVVVYTNVGVEASLVWFALTLSGYDARLYSWRDWLENQPKFDYDLTDIEAKPNPVRSGQATTITASFQEKQAKAGENSSKNGEVKLTVKGCVTCGFGSPQSYANLDRKDGYVQIGSSDKPPQESAGTLKCTAVIKDSQGVEVGEVNTLRTSGERYVGIWNAKINPDVYKVSMVASDSGLSKTFPDVLEIKVT